MINLSKRYSDYILTAGVISIAILAGKFADILAPFFIGFLISYCLKGLHSKLSTITRSKTISSLILIIGILSSVYFLIFNIVPIMVKFVNQISLATSNILVKVENKQRLLDIWTSSLPPAVSSKTHELISEISKLCITKLASLVTKIIQYKSSVAYAVNSIIIITLVVFYTTRDMNKIYPSLISWIPAKHRKLIDRMLNKLDQTFYLYITGQTMIALGLFCYHSLILSYLRIENRYFLAMICGLMSFIPIMGSVISCLLSVLAVASAGRNAVTTVIIAHVVASIFDSYFVVPKLFGQKVGAHPIFLFLVINVLLSFFGIKGTILAMPTTLFIAALLKETKRILETETDLYREQDHDRHQQKH